MSKKVKVIAVIYFIVMGIVIFGSKDISKVATNLEYIACGSATKIPKPIPQLTTIAYTLAITATPLALIVFSIITLIKAISSGNADDVSKAKSKLLSKVIITAIIFLVAGLVQFILNRVTSTEDDKATMANCMKCFLYFKDSDCPLVNYDDEVRPIAKRSHRSYSISPGSSSNSNSSSNKNSNGSTTGSFTEDEVYKLALFMMKWEGGLDANGNLNYKNYGVCGGYNQNEYGITIGAGGWMGPSAKNLLNEIKSKYPNTFSKYDTDKTIATALQNKSFANFDYCPSKDSKDATTIINIISSDDGKKVQDEMIKQNVKDYITEANSKGIKDKKSIVLYMNVRHVFGPGGVMDLVDASKPDYKFDVMSKKVLELSKYNGMAGWTNRWKSAIEYANSNF